jgi:hypothetical protein
MSDQIIFTDAIQTIDAVVIRCNCGNPTGHGGEICPKGKRVDYGTISYAYGGHPFRTALMTAWIRVRRRFINDR